MSRKRDFSGNVGAESRLEWVEESVNCRLKNVRGCWLEIKEKVVFFKI